ncbi:MAG: hypothetical protein U0936_11560 [Planctomycetaceae bacterium]
MIRRILVLSFALISLLLMSSAIFAQQGGCCISMSICLNEQRHASKHFARGEVVRRPDGADECDLVITEVFQSHDDSLKVGETIKASLSTFVTEVENSNFGYSVPTTLGTQYLVFADADDESEAAQVVGEATESLTTYMKVTGERLKSLKSPDRRQRIFADYVCDPDLVVRNDAMMELFSAGPTPVYLLAPHIPIEDVRKVFTDPKTPARFLGMYGFLLGIAGISKDAVLLERKILTFDEDFRPGLEGIIAGYVLLKGEEGLKAVENSKLIARTATNSEGKEVQLPFSETYAALQAIDYLLEIRPATLTRERTLASYYLLLDRSSFSDLVVTRLMRAKDWSIQNRVIAMLDNQELKIPATRRAIARYLMASSTEVTLQSPGGKRVPTEQAREATEVLKKLQDTDPSLLERVRRLSPP